MALVWQTIRNGLKPVLDARAAWSGVSTYAGEPLAGDQTPSYFAIGFVLDEDQGGTFQLGRRGDGFSRSENGEVRCSLWSYNGDGDLTAAEDAAFALVEDLDALNGPSGDLGGLLPQGFTCDLVCEPLLSDTAAGTGQLLVVSIVYQSYI